ncbi:MAG: hypothetical protein IKJ39_11195 [Lachnospiraceae bacterium]|nr:hypothetical protein [Lachnospiraceae bacterium]
MKHNNGDTFEEALKNPAYIAMGSGVFLLVVVLFCVIVWNSSHANKDTLVLNQPAGNTVEIPSMGERITDEVIVTPAPEVVTDTEEERIKQLIAEKSNDQGLVFEPVDDWITAKEVTNLRSEPSTEKGVESVVVKLSNGTAVRRVGINEETGWSKIIYEDGIVYASTAYMVEAEAPTEE